MAARLHGCNPVIQTAPLLPFALTAEIPPAVFAAAGLCRQNQYGAAAFRAGGRERRLRASAPSLEDLKT